MLGQFIFTATLIAAVMFISANLYLAEAKDPKSEESEQLKEFGGFFYKSSRYTLSLLYRVLIVPHVLTAIIMVIFLIDCLISFFCNAFITVP